MLESSYTDRNVLVTSNELEDGTDIIVEIHYSITVAMETIPWHRF